MEHSYSKVFLNEVEQAAHANVNHHNNEIVRLPKRERERDGDGERVFERECNGNFFPVPFLFLSHRKQMNSKRRRSL
jgi:hypothetical protein